MFGTSKANKLFSAQQDDRWESVGEIARSSCPGIIAYRYTDTREFEAILPRMRLVDTGKPVDDSITKMLTGKESELRNILGVEVFIPADTTLLVMVIF